MHVRISRRAPTLVTTIACRATRTQRPNAQVSCGRTTARLAARSSRGFPAIRWRLQNSDLQNRRPLSARRPEPVEQRIEKSCREAFVEFLPVKLDTRYDGTDAGHCLLLPCGKGIETYRAECTTSGLAGIGRLSRPCEALLAHVKRRQMAAVTGGAFAQFVDHALGFRQRAARMSLRSSSLRESQRPRRRRRRRFGLLPVCGSTVSSGPRSIRTTGRMMTVAGSLPASTYLPRPIVSSGKRMTSPIAVPFSTLAADLTAQTRRLRAAKVNGPLTGRGYCRGNPALCW